MNKLAIVFGATTVAFAGLTFYYASELRKEDDFFDAQSTIMPAGPALATSHSSPAAARPSNDAMASGTGAPVSNASLPQSVAPANNPTGDVAGKPASKLSASDLDFLKMYADPQGRRILIEEALVDQRNGLRGLGEKLGLTEEHWQRVLDVFAAQQVEGRAAILRCRADPACKSPFTPQQLADQKQQVRDAIGEDNFSDYDRYVKSMNERRAVAELQKQLTGSLALPADRAEALIAALVDEREAALREMTDGGGKVGGIGVQNGFVYYNTNAPTFEARMESGIQYSNRIRERAATVLNASQIATFNQMQDQLMATFRAYLVRNTPQPPAPQKSAQTTART